MLSNSPMQQMISGIELYCYLETLTHLMACVRLFGGICVCLVAFALFGWHVRDRYEYRHRYFGMEKDQRLFMEKYAKAISMLNCTKTSKRIDKFVFHKLLHYV